MKRDSFKGIPPVNPDQFPADSVHRGAELLSAHEQNSPDKVVSTFKLFQLWDPDKVHILDGYFNETLPAANESGAFNQFSILRLDGDTYESTIEGLRILYPRLSIGGFVIIDDYLDWHGAREATKDYREQHGIGGGPRRKNENLVAIYHDAGKREIPRGVYWQKMHPCC